jgi:hypothetical protein
MMEQASAFVGRNVSDRVSAVGVPRKQIPQYSWVKMHLAPLKSHATEVSIELKDFMSGTSISTPLECQSHLQVSVQSLPRRGLVNNPDLDLVDGLEVQGSFPH